MTNKKKNKHLYIFFVLLAFSVHDKSLNNNLQEQYVQKIEITYVDFDILTPIDISCDYFDVIFNNIKKSKIIVDNIIINQIMNDIKEIKAKGKEVANLNVRYKMKLYYNDGSVQIICGNSGKIKLGNKIYFVTKKFYSLLREQLNKNDR
jgi:hypothetical protein